MTQDVDVPGVGTLSFPDGMSQSDMASAIQKNYPQIHGGPPVPKPGFLDNALSTLNSVGRGVLSAGPAETALHLGSSAVGGLGGGLSYLGTLAGTGGDTDAAKAVQEATQQALTYQPKTAAGKAISAAADKALGIIPQALDKAGAATADATGSPLLGAAVNTAGNAALQFAGFRGLRGAGGAAEEAAAAAPKAPPSTPGQLLQQSLDNGKSVGYQTTPNFDPTASFVDKLGQGVAGKAQLEQGARVQNQPVTNALAARAIGQDPASLLTQTKLNAIRNEAVAQGYAPVKELGTIPADAQFLRNNAAIASKSGDPLSGNPDVVATSELLERPSFDAAKITDQISTLRSRAQDASAQGRASAAGAFQAQASELESLLDRHLQTLDQPDVLTKYRAARKLIAQTYTVGENLNPSTGNVNASGVGQMLKNGTPLDGDLKTIADFANSAPPLASVPNGTPLPTSPINTMAGAVTAHATGGASLGMIPAARAFAAKWLVRHNDTPALLQPLDKTLGQKALDAVHGNATAFTKMYGSSGAALPGGAVADQQ